MYQNLGLKSRWEKLAKWGREYQNIIFASSILVMIFFIGLGLGLLIKPSKPTPIIIDKNVKTDLSADLSAARQPDFYFGNFVASINGKNYYPKNCPSAKKIKEENMIWFGSAKEAEVSGYAPAKNCP